jgi:5-methylcytosine-specific restriction endonuclease McrA
MAKVDKEKPYNGGEWTVARYNSFVKGGLRSASQRWPPKYKVLAAAKRGRQINPASGRLAEMYECTSCQSLFPAKEVEVNHIIPVVPITGFDSWDGVIERMFCEAEHLEVLCKNCHKEHTREENDERKVNKGGDQPKI